MQVTAALQDMRITVSKLPKAVVREYVPASLLRPGMFGSLAFGGDDAAKMRFEQNRSAREARLRETKQRQQELYRKVHLAVHGLRSEDQASVGVAHSSSSASSLETETPQQANRTSDYTSNPGEREKECCRSGPVYPICAPTSSCAALAVKRAGTAPYCEPSVRQSPSASFASMPRHMEYVEHSKQSSSISVVCLSVLSSPMRCGLLYCLPFCMCVLICVCVCACLSSVDYIRVLC
ncbi:hypothetical protein NXY56_006593 [Leishmania guyanensis]